MKIVFCGGGTAGHIMPAISIAEILTKRYNAEILFIGRDGGAENKSVISCGYPLLTLKISGLRRSLSVKNIKTLYLLIKANSDAKKILTAYKPDIVIGTGGYVSWPVMRCAEKLNIPTVIHESNATPGLVNKLLAPKCKRVLVNFPDSKNEFRKKDNVRVVGNPVREEFFNTGRLMARKKLGIEKNTFLILSLGGSGGSEKINDVSIELMKNYSRKHSNVNHVHSSGNKYFEILKSKYPEFTKGKFGCQIKPYIDNMPIYLSAADVVISRCGAVTLSEISAVGVPAILIPSPNVTNNHQLKNALYVSKDDAAIVIEEDKLSEEILEKKIELLRQNPNLRTEMQAKIKSRFCSDSKEKILKEILPIIRAKSSN